MSDQLRCERCGRFINPDTCAEGWTGGLFGDYNGKFYCENGRGCNVDLETARSLEAEHRRAVSEGRIDFAGPPPYRFRTSGVVIVSRPFSPHASMGDLETGGNEPG